MNRKINYNDFQKMLIEHNAPEACQYFTSLWDAYTAYMPISFSLAEEMAKKINQGETKFLDNMDNEINNQLANGAVACYRPKISDFPRNICKIEELDIFAEVMFEKSVYDFFHWVRVCFDILVQLINASILKENPVNSEDNQIVSKTIKSLTGKKECQKLLEIIKKTGSNPEYQYVKAFDNCMKHIKLVPSNVISVQISFGMQPPPPKFTIEAFSHNGRSYDKVDALEQIIKVEEFARTAIYQMLLEIENIVAVDS